MFENTERFITNFSSFHYLNARCSLEFNSKNEQHAKSPWDNCLQYFLFRDRVQSTNSTVFLKYPSLNPESRQTPAFMNTMAWILCCALESENQVICVRRVSGGLQFNLLLRAGPAMRSAWAAHAFIQVCLENLQGWRLHNLSEQPLPDCPHGEKDLPHTQSELLFFQLMTAVCHPSAMHCCTEAGSVVSVSSCRSGPADAP